MTSYFRRYCDGEREAVWAELMALGPAVRHPAILPDAEAVARETMRRAGENARRIVARLGEQGYRFLRSTGHEWQPNEQVIVPPDAEIGEHIRVIEATVGLLPLSLRAWYEVIGTVRLIGEHPAWDRRAYPDPLVIDGLDDWWRDDYAAWCDFRAETGDPSPFALGIAPDYYHKSNVSGGEPYGIAVPCAGADAPVLRMWQKRPFVEYLRHCFRWGGFPGWERLDLGQLPGQVLPKSVRPDAQLAALAADLLPI